VIAAFRDVQAARADQERIQNQAQTYANQVVPEAKGRATQITAAASAYHDQIIAEAKGAADRFEQVYESYVAAPDVTRKRMYLETMESILSSVDKVIIDDSAAKTGVVPYLPLPQLVPSPSPPASPSSAPAMPDTNSAPSVSPVPSSSSVTGGGQ
jgi:membrane protease subunit HflK